VKKRVVAPGGHGLAALTFDFEGGAIARIEIARLQPTDRVEARGGTGS